MKELYALAYLAALGAAAHFIGNLLPRQWFGPARAPYRCWRWEKSGQIYTRLGVRRWKDKVPDMSKICGDMRPKALRAGMTDADMTALIQETCVAECVHAALILLSPVVVMICPNGFGAALLLADIFLFNLPFMIIQRYNRPKLCRLQAALRKKRGGKLTANETSDTLQQHRTGTQLGGESAG